MHRLALALLLLAVGVAACGGGLSQTDRDDLENAQRLDAFAYRYQDAATPGAALVRGAYCSTSAVIRDQKLSGFDAGIACQVSTQP